LFVKRGEKVTKDQKLYAIVPLPESDDVIVAKARVSQANHDLKKIESDYVLQQALFERNKRLYLNDVISKEDFDIIKANYDSVKAQLEGINYNIKGLKAELHKGEWILRQKTSFSSDDALVFDTYYQPGELVKSNSPILSLLKGSSIKVVFYSPETYLKKLKLNQHIALTCDGCNKPIKAKIVYISPNTEYNPPVIYSSESRTKLTFRVEAKPIDIDALSELHPGQPVSVIIN
jgi:HlyD family secretion protein